MLSVQRLNLIDFIPVFGFDYVNLVSCLQAQPELLGGAENFASRTAVAVTCASAAQCRSPGVRGRESPLPADRHSFSSVREIPLSGFLPDGPSNLVVLPRNTHLILISVVIHDFHVVPIAILPSETNAVLIINPNAPPFRILCRGWGI